MRAAEVMGAVGARGSTTVALSCEHFRKIVSFRAYRLFEPRVTGTVAIAPAPLR